jgi:hypothetical protein
MRRRKAVRFLRGLQRCQDDGARRRLARRFAALYPAHALYADPPCFEKWELEARLLTAEPFAAIGRKFGMSRAVVESYHVLFFEVVPHLHARDWIAHRVLGRKARVGLTEGDVDLLLKIYALAGGPLAVDALVDYHRHPPVVPDKPELLAPHEREELGVKLLIRVGILARTLAADDPKALKKVALLQQAMDLLRGSDTEGGAGLAAPPRLTADLPSTALTAAGAALDLLAQAAAVA